MSLLCVVLWSVNGRDVHAENTVTTSGLPREEEAAAARSTQQQQQHGRMLAVRVG